ncbi:phage baseplate assembly protein V [Crossiella cryophila]|uniref:Gp5/Type VI secretion system Vgr protein OB-fold domain-containing protein n=1 Tax=Crossiella cryophila TaxID=43355 RepID=A0A7W7CBD7_9PSEU|nr:phage baseplate assembly protein V [Crossiella cryophila]MBB4677912.1 hypothetical protein [Crossiella cryophila]
MIEQSTKFTGLYRGVVVSAIDPLDRGRLLVKVSDVLGDLPAIWAEPATPLATPGGGGIYVRPLPMAGVWIGFEEGDPERAVWLGFWRGGKHEVPAEVNAALPGVPVMVLATSAQNAIVLNDSPGGGLTLRHGTALISITDAGILLSNGKGATITLAGNTVSVNGPALQVT